MELTPAPRAVGCRWDGDGAGLEEGERPAFRTDMLSPGLSLGLAGLLTSPAP